MATAGEGKSTAERLLEVALFAPLGLVVTVGEVLPELAQKGRDRAAPQLGVARAVGQLAVGQGRQRLASMVPWTGRPPVPSVLKAGGAVLPPLDKALEAIQGLMGPFGWGRRPMVRAQHTYGTERAAEASRSPAPSAPPGAERPVRPVVRRPPDIESASGHVSRPHPAAEHDGSAAAVGQGRAATPRRARAGAPGLAIPSYDTLSASQVVQRLAGLSRDEIKAVRAYEAATRGRRTILARADQLLA